MILFLRIASNIMKFAIGAIFFMLPAYMKVSEDFNVVVTLLGALLIIDTLLGLPDLTTCARLYGIRRRFERQH